MRWRTRLAYRLLPPQTWGQLKNDWALSRRRLTNRRRRLQTWLSTRQDLRLHLGCGLRATPGWLNIDAVEQPGLDVRWDLRDPLPCEAGVAALIYTEHVLEHLEYEDARALLRELYRLLAPDGRVRLGVPDAELYMQAYIARDTGFFEQQSRIGNPSSPLDTPIKVINQMFRMGGAHRFAWDFETLRQQLVHVGFVNVTRWPAGQGSRADLCLDDPSHAAETLYVEADKPRQRDAALRPRARPGDGMGDAA
ncbi:MAG: class I SAM-dependent methyltransferase [Acidobacteriota bacterium]